MGATAFLEERTVAVQPGAEAVVRVRVQNNGQVVDQFSLEVLGEPAAWAAVEPPTLSIFPGREEVAVVRFRPPRSSTTRAGDFPFGVRVSSREDPAGSVVEEGVVSVGTFMDSAAEVVPKNSRGRGSANHELALDNRGNVPLRAELSATDPGGELSFRFQPPVLEVEPGRAGFSRLRVRTRRRFLSGPPRQHPFQVQVAAQGAAPTVLDASMVQEALVAPWMRAAALLAVAALVAGALLWFLALKPGIESTARAAVASPLAQQSSAIAQLQQKVAAGGGATSPSPSPGPSAGGGGAGAGGVGFARRLTVAVPQYKVPAGQTLFVTDLVFENPNGEHGTVALQRDGVALLVENLDNFRDLDFHFVTPLTANANQTLSLSVNCSPPCTAVGLYVNGYQKPS